MNWRASPIVVCAALGVFVIWAGCKDKKDERCGNGRVGPMDYVITCVPRP